MDNSRNIYQQYDSREHKLNQLERIEQLERERDVLKKKVRSSETDLLVQIYSNAYDAVIICDVKGYIIRVNRRFCDMFRVSKIEDMIGKNILDYLSANIVDYYEEIIEHEVNFKGCWRGVITNDFSDRASIDLEITVHKTSNNIVIIQMREFYELYKQDNNDYDEGMYKGILNNLKSQVLVRDNEGVVLFKNRGFEDFRGKMNDEELRDLYRDDNDDVLRTKKNKHLNKEFAASRLGRGAWLRTNIIHGELEGESITISESLDITESVRSFENIFEQTWLLEQITNRMTDSVLISDSKDRIIYVNKSFLDLVGEGKSKIIGAGIKGLAKRIGMNCLLEKYEKMNIGHEHEEYETEFNYAGQVHYLKCSIMSLVKADQLKATLFLMRDQSREKLAETIINSSDQYFENSLIGFYRTSPHGRILKANSAFMKMFGIRDKADLEKINLDAQSIMSNYPRKDFREEMESKGFVIGFEAELLNKDGKKIYTRESAQAVKDKYGNVVYYEGTVEDISDRIEIERSLRESEERYRTIVDMSPESIVTLDRQGYIRSCNASYKKMIGFTDEDLIGNHIANNPYVIDKDKHMELLGKILQGDINNPYEVQWRDKSGNIHHGRMYFGELKRNGYVFGYQAILNDITKEITAREALEGSERKLRNFIKYSRDGIVLVGARGEIIEWNEACERITGIEQRFTIGKKVWELKFFPSDMPHNGRGHEVQTETESLLSSGMGKYLNRQFEVCFHHRNGKVVYASMINFTFKIGENHMIGCVVRDISNYKHIENALKQSERELRLSNNEKDRLFSIIGHDLRSPLSGFAGLANLLWQRYDQMQPDEIKDIAKVMSTSAIGIIELLENLLEWSMARRGMTHLAPEYMELADLMKICSGVHMPSILEKNIEIDFDINESTLVYGDRNALTTILRNLCSNAIKYSWPGGRVYAKATPLDNGYLELTVKDEGVGMVEEDLSNLFAIDKLKSRVGTAKEKGTGLGLLLSKELIELHGGSIEVESEYGKGSTFRVLLPGNQFIYEYKAVTNENQS